MKIDTCDLAIQNNTPGCSKIGTCDMNGCYKLTSFDWLADVPLPSENKNYPFVEVRFKNSRKAFYKRKNIDLKVGDVVAVEAKTGHDVGTVSMTGDLVRLQMKKKNVDPENSELFKIYRKANQRDIDRWQELRLREEEVKHEARKYVIKHDLQMKISDVEYQADGSKVTFYYTADGRVDFRSLIKDLARAFSTRIEMRQIGFRQEAARLGGIGSCGRELCCSSWMTDFKSVSTSTAKHQQLSLNPQKLAGQCGKLKCCLNYELDSYMDALEDFPAHNIQLKTEKGNAKWIKSDIYQGYLWYAYVDTKENGNVWHKMSLEQVHEIIDINKQGEKIQSLEEYSAELSLSEVKPVDNFENVVGQDNINRFDESKKKRKKKRRKKTKNLQSKNHKSKSNNTSQKNTVNSKNKNKNRRKRFNNNNGNNSKNNR